MGDKEATHRKAIIGHGKNNFWLYDSQKGYDLTHPPTPLTPTVPSAIALETATETITIDPAKTALVIVDMQNFFLAPELGRDPKSKGLQVQGRLLESAIPAARRAGIRIVWLNWGLTQSDLEVMPPALVNGFRFQSVPASQFEQWAGAWERGLGKDHLPPDDHSLFDARLESLGRDAQIYKGLGAEMGLLPNHSSVNTVDGGRLLMRDQWNTELTPALKKVYEEGRNQNPPDVWMHKNRLSGFHGASTPVTEFLDKQGIKTLIFAGVNTDQCVGGSIQDAYSKGYDVILLRDAAATSSPAFAQQMIEFNCEVAWGFCMSCDQLVGGVTKARPV